MLLKGKIVRRFRALSIEAFIFSYRIWRMGVFSSEISAPVIELTVIPRNLVVGGSETGDVNRD
jgi:hypothetical protein